MSRKNIKCSPETYARLRSIKRTDETWDELLTRLAEYHEIATAAGD